MRRCDRIAVLCVMALLLSPPRAHAWFAFLDYLSGPGPFYGPKFDARVWCFGAKVPLNEAGRELKSAVDLTAATKSLRSLEALEAVKGQWKKFTDATSRVNTGLNRSDDDGLETFKSELSILLTARGAGPIYEVSTAELLHLLARGEALLDHADQESLSIAGTGVFISFCPPEIRRTFSIEGGFTTLQAGSNPFYANNHTIRLNTFTAALSYRPQWKADRDVLDFGVSAGMYRFSSAGFETFRGVIMEPFVDIHGPSQQINAGALQQLASQLTLRLSVVFFPGGFEAAAFGATGDTARRIKGGEGTFSATVFFNLLPTIRRRAHVF
jgi:hypothetical protein